MRSPTIPGREPGVATPVRGPAEDAVPTSLRDIDPGDAGTTVVRRFAATAVSVGQARRFLLEQFSRGCHEDVEVTALMLSELATNAVQHADTCFEVAITVTPALADERRCVLVRVADEAPGFPTPHDPPPDAPHGRGLRIVESLAESWGVEVQRGRPGKTVWFTARVDGAIGCADQADGPDGVPTPVGPWPNADHVLLLAARRLPAGTRVGPDPTGGGRFVV